MCFVCDGISIIQKSDNILLGGPISHRIDYKTDEMTFVISIEQCGTRRIIITASQSVELTRLLELFTRLDMLLMIFEGRFVPVYSGNVFAEGVETCNLELQKLLDDRVGFFDSADFTSGNHSCFISFDTVLSAEVFRNWEDILKELDILHPMVLYSMANTGLPTECKCAFLIEAFEALAELVAEKEETYNLPIVGRYESKLGKRLESLIASYGKEVFVREIARGLDSFVSVLVDSRNRIAHIKSRQEKRVLDGKEAVLYAVKLSYLYRIIILTLLGINYEVYAEKVKSSVARWDAWQNILEGLLQSIS